MLAARVTDGAESRCALRMMRGACEPDGLRRYLGSPDAEDQ